MRFEEGFVQPRVQVTNKLILTRQPKPPSNPLRHFDPPQPPLPPAHLPTVRYETSYQHQYVTHGQPHYASHASPHYHNEPRLVHRPILHSEPPKTHNARAVHEDPDSDNASYKSVEEHFGLIVKIKSRGSSIPSESLRKASLGNEVVPFHDGRNYQTLNKEESGLRSSKYSDAILHFEPSVRESGVITYTTFNEPVSQLLPSYYHLAKRAEIRQAELTSSQRLIGAVADQFPTVFQSSLPQMPKSETRSQTGMFRTTTEPAPQTQNITINTVVNQSLHSQGQFAPQPTPQAPASTQFAQETATQKLLPEEGLLPIYNVEFFGVGVYKGELKDGMMDGKGQLYDKDGFLLFEGSFKENQFEGMGKLHSKEAKEAELKEVEGHWNLEQIEEGLEEYEGAFKQGIFDGIGMIKYKGGAEFFGEFKDGKADGFGIWTKGDQRLAGIWSQNKLQSRF